MSNGDYSKVVWMFVDVIFKWKILNLCVCVLRLSRPVKEAEDEFKHGSIIC